MWGARAQQSGLGGYGADLLAALLGLSFLLSQHARAAEPTNVTSAANQTTQTMTSTLSEGKETGARVAFKGRGRIPAGMSPLPSLLSPPLLSPYLPSGT